jgi:hypothetical protein
VNFVQNQFCGNHFVEDFAPMVRRCAVNLGCVGINATAGGELLRHFA